MDGKDVLRMDYTHKFCELRDAKIEIERLKNQVRHWENQSDDLRKENIWLRAESERLLKSLKPAAEVLDIAQAMLEQSIHHPQILAAYKLLRNAIAATEGKE